LDTWGIHEAAQPFQVAWFSASDQTMCSKFSVSCEMRAFSLGNCLHHKDLLGFVNSPCVGHLIENWRLTRWRGGNRMLNNNPESGTGTSAVEVPWGELKLS
jgi:hypothetical protein